MKNIKLFGKAPLRLGLGGGGTDLNDVFEKYGGQVINATINKYVNAAIKYNFITSINEQQPDDFTKTILKKSKGEKVCILSWNDVPYGRGLGNSSAYSVLLTKLIFELRQEKISDDKLAEIVYGIENQLGKCGWQDQYASIKGGFNWLEFAKDGTKTITKLNIKPETISKLEKSLCLVYSGITHNSGMVQSSKPIMSEEKANQLKELAVMSKDCLINDDIKSFPYILNKGWELKKSDATISPEINSLFELGLKSGAEGGKVCGAGKGGYILFFIPERKMEEFKINMHSNKYQTLDFTFENEGVRIWHI